MGMQLQRRGNTLEIWLDKVKDGDGNETTEEREYIRNMVGQSKGWRWK